jgi:hypothetical protein
MAATQAPPSSTYIVPHRGHRRCRGGHGTGSLKGIAGNKTNKAEVCFVARAEDRNEPGSTGQNDGAYKDRYFIRVLDCATSAQLLVLEQTTGAGDPITITDGNMQIRISSCP